MARRTYAQQIEQNALLNATGAATRLGVSRGFLYRLPKSTPGVYKFGRALRFDIRRLKAWAGKG
jgi:hypothetical protein